ncbi:MAG: bifunctional folylpolyglutamate synthase/dihydrofolate synthase [Elusimicrobia bacterium]|nr:bifunctional folylpolyglutamate synthase/dihydrofolate synthase [Elusimicrobiota bacterium]
MNYEEALKLLEDRKEARIELGLERVRAHLERLDDPHKGLPAIHVAGTNGKGSLCAILESVFRSAGLKTGLYLSPHLSEVRERVRVSGGWITPEDFGRLMGRVSAADPDAKLTYFELLTSLAFLYFKEQAVDVAILETGLGGRLDATNVIDRPMATVISQIGLDHTQMLGETVRSVAREKAGILKEGCRAFCPVLPEEALAPIKERATELKAPLTVVENVYRVASVDWEGNRQELIGPGGRATLSLLGDRQAYNVALARAVIESIGSPPPDPVWAAGLASVRWPGRFESLRLGGKHLILDGAHNLQAAAALASTWNSSPWGNEDALWILGIMRDKDVEGVLEAIAAAFPRRFAAVEPSNPRALSAQDLAAKMRARFPSVKIQQAKLEPALLGWLEGEGPRVAVVCGSLYLVGEARRILESRTSERVA